MKKQNKLFAILLILTFVVSACGGVANTNTMEGPEPIHETMIDEAMPTHDAMMNDSQSMTETMVESADGGMMTAPDWFSVSLFNVNTGETFTINDLKGKVILVETMAVWCSNCFKQQSQVKVVHESLDLRDDFVSIGIDIDPNENPAKLLAFTTKNGFDWMYVVSPTDVSREIASLYGSQYLNPPSTPMLIIDRHGETHLLPFGIKSADDLMQALQPYLDEAM